MKCIKLFFKRQKLLKKYKLTDEKRMKQMNLLSIMIDDSFFRSFYNHQIFCEIRCYNRLKNGKMNSKQP